MLVMKRPRFSTCRIGSAPSVPFDDADLSGQNAGLDADVGDRLGETEGAAPGLAVLAGLGGGAEAQVCIALLGGAALVDRG